MHSFAIGQSDQLAVDVKPGEMTDVTLVFDRPGKYTFYCTPLVQRESLAYARHNRGDRAGRQPLRQSNRRCTSTLGLNLDGEHHAEVIPDQKPSSLRGALLNVAMPVEYQSREYYLSHSTAELWRALRAEAGFSKAERPGYLGSGCLGLEIQCDSSRNTNWKAALYGELRRLSRRTWQRGRGVCRPAYSQLSRNPGNMK